MTYYSSGYFEELHFYLFNEYYKISVHVNIITMKYRYGFSCGIVAIQMVGGGHV